MKITKVKIMKIPFLIPFLKKNVDINKIPHGIVEQGEAENLEEDTL